MGLTRISRGLATGLRSGSARGVVGLTSSTGTSSDYAAPAGDPDLIGTDAV